MERKVGLDEHQIRHEHDFRRGVGAFDASPRQACIRGRLAREQAEDHRSVEADAQGRYPVPVPGQWKEM